MEANVELGYHPYLTTAWNGCLMSSTLQRVVQSAAVSIKVFSALGLAVP